MRPRLKAANAESALKSLTDYRFFAAALGLAAKVSASEEMGSLRSSTMSVAAIFGIPQTVRFGPLKSSPFQDTKINDFERLLGETFMTSRFSQCSAG
jgi:hypothetical protein